MAGAVHQITVSRRWPRCGVDQRGVLRKELIMLRKKAIVAVCGALLFAVTGYAQDTSIRPFKVNVSEESLVDLRRRVAATRWPDRETVSDQSQGVQLATV